MLAKVVGRTLTPAPLPGGEGFTAQAIRVFIGRQLNAWMDDGDTFGGDADLPAQCSGGLAVGDHHLHAANGRQPQRPIERVLDRDIQAVDIDRGIGAAGARSPPGQRRGQPAAGQHDVGLPACRLAPGQALRTQQESPQRLEGGLAHLDAGWRIKSTRLSDSFGVDDFFATHGSDALALFSLDEQGRLHVVSEARALEAKPGWSLTALVAPRDDAPAAATS